MMYDKREDEEAPPHAVQQSNGKVEPLNPIRT